MLVCWLEDSKIRELQIAERQGLKQEQGWEESFRDYLTRLSCPLPLSPATTLECVEWLVSHAVAVEFEECSEVCIGIEDREGNSCGSSSSSSSSGGEGDDTGMEVNNEGYLADLDSANLGVEIDFLGKLVHMQRLGGEASIDFMQRISRQIRLLLTPGSLDALKSNLSSESLSEFPLGFDTKDEIVNKVAVVLKMLYLSDFRELQNDLNALIVLGQEVTKFFFLS